MHKAPPVKKPDSKGLLIGEYRVIEQIAEGGFGRTYLGEHVLTGLPVCIKDCSKISPEYEQILLNEAMAMWDLRHFAIPAVRNIIRLPTDSLALVMSYIPGPTLEKIVEKHGKIDPEHVAWIAERILNALKYMHYHGVIHGDLKPQNIIIQPENHMVVIVDFGLAMVKPKSDSNSKGYTPLFASPEQIAKKSLTPGSDFYSLGMTMLYALGGGTEAVEKLQIPHATPLELEKFIKRLIVRDVMSRPTWKTEDLQESIQTVREKAFGRKSSAMRPLKY